jgi:predicted NBD/HSP70 family sugar kinase
MTSPDPRPGASIVHGDPPRLLNDMQMPDLIDSQIARFTRASLHATRARSFDPQATLHALKTTSDTHVMAVDIGGYKVIADHYAIRHGTLYREGRPLIKERTSGAGYIDVLEKAATLAHTNLLPTGVSYAGPIEGSRVLAGMNVPVFIQDLQSRYHGDFANLDSQIILLNDAEAGAIAASVEAVRRYPTTKNVLYVINGSGIGGAVLTHNVIYATEAGHIQVEDSLNNFNQSTPCGMFGAAYVCLERVAASKAGIEDIWYQQREERLSGQEIAAAYLAGDELALDLYENSALITAHIVKGMAAAFGLLEEWDDTVVVGHGGTFQVPGYSERVRSILERDLSSQARMLFTKDFSLNTCLDGAAIAAACGSIPSVTREAQASFQADHAQHIDGSQPGTAKITAE